MINESILRSTTSGRGLQYVALQTPAASPLYGSFGRQAENGTSPYSEKSISPEGVISSV